MIFFSLGLRGRRIDDLIFFPKSRVDAGVRHFVDLPPVCPSAKSAGQARLWCISEKALGHSRWRKILSSIVEGSMPAREGEELRYPTVEFVLHTVAGWINKHRANGGCDELGRCNPEDAIQIAKDLGVPVGDLQGLTAKRATAANALPKMLSALFVDAQAPTDGDPAVMRDLQRTCILCDHKSRCRRELAKGSAAQHFREFCPNAYTFDALLKQKSTAAPH